MIIRHLALAAASLLALNAHAAAVKYDDFNVTTGIDRVKWNESEAARFIDNNKLILGRYIYGGTASDTGLTMESWNMNVPVSAPVKGLRADVTVDDIKQNESCPANASVGFSSARLIGAFFNIRAGGPVPGDRTGDVLAQVRVRRLSNSADAPGVMQVQGVLSQCTNADCSTSAALPGVTQVVSLGSVTVGTPMRLQFAWDKKTDTFTYTRDGAITASITYTQDDSVAPATVFANVSLRNEIQNCTTQRIKAGIAGTFDNVYVTQ